MNVPTGWRWSFRIALTSRSIRGGGSSEEQLWSRVYIYLFPSLTERTNEEDMAGRKGLGDATTPICEACLAQDARAHIREEVPERKRTQRKCRTWLTYLVAEI